MEPFGRVMKRASSVPKTVWVGVAMKGRPDHSLPYSAPAQKDTGQKELRRHRENRLHLCVRLTLPF